MGGIDVKDFFKMAIKIAVAIFVAAIALTVVGAAIWKVVDIREKDEAKLYEVVKDWQVDLKSNLGMQLSARTKVIDSRLLMSVRFDGYPAYLSDPRLSKKNSDARFLLSFLDQDGFKLYEKSLKVSELSKIVDAQGRETGLNHQFDGFISIDSYKRFARLDVEWTLDTVVQVAPGPAPVAETKYLDHCAPRLTRAERLERLAQHGTVRETGYEQFSAGDKTINVSSDGTVIYCR